ncbi:hypothetical protein HZH66_006985 [Vespula vulgaris]|uniref:Uncharacterized protein n=1 Tax=Vespula vulgaris TaxID=7454 RepID=A0A834N6I7_VESVU|nr:hypothetical protein HZH66_006985 [Vespula vulgaris]
MKVRRLTLASSRCTRFDDDGSDDDDDDDDDDGVESLSTEDVRLGPCSARTPCQQYLGTRFKERKGLEVSRHRLIPGSSMWPQTVVSRELRDPMEAKSRRRDTRVGGGSYGACPLPRQSILLRGQIERARNRKASFESRFHRVLSLLARRLDGCPVFKVIIQMFHMCPIIVPRRSVMFPEAISRYIPDAVYLRVFIASAIYL